MDDSWKKNLTDKQQQALATNGGGLDYVKFMGWHNQLSEPDENGNTKALGTADWYTKALADQAAAGIAPKQIGIGLTNTQDAIDSANKSAVDQAKIKSDQAAADAAAKADPNGPYAPSPQQPNYNQTSVDLSKNNPYGLGPNTSGPNGVLINAQGFVVSPNTSTDPISTTTTINNNPVNNNSAGIINPAKITETPTSTPSNTVILKQGSGSSGAPDEGVRAIQKQLGITADGIFGPQTKSAVMAFQQKNGLTVDGIVGPQTQAALVKIAQSGGLVNNSGVSTQTKPADDPSNQFNTSTGQPNPNYKAPGDNSSVGGNNNATDILKLNADANADMEKLLSQFKETVGTNVDVSDSSKILAALGTSLATPPPSSPSLLQTYNNQRAQLGVGPLEDSLASTDAAIAKLDADNKALQENNDNRVEGISQINRRKSADQINYEKSKNDLTLQRNNIANQLNQKYSVIDNIVKYTQADAQTATQDYTTKFNQAITLTNLIKGVQDDQKSTQEQASDNARANATLMINTLKGKNVDFSNLDASTSADLKNLEIQAGLPTGFIQFALSATDQPVISIGTEFTSGDSRQVPIYTKNPSTGVVTTSVVILGNTPEGADKNKNLQQDIQTSVTDMANAVAAKKWRGVDPTMYQHYRQQIFDQYGQSGVTKLDAAIKTNKLIVDYGSASDAAFKALNKREI